MKLEAKIYWVSKASPNFSRMYFKSHCALQIDRVCVVFKLYLLEKLLDMHVFRLSMSSHSIESPLCTLRLTQLPSSNYFFVSIYLAKF